MHLLPLVEITVHTTEADEDIVDCEPCGGSVGDLEDCQSTRVRRLSMRDVRILLP
jgi:hypothetical protein